MSGVKIFSSKRRWAAAACLVLALFLLRPGASRLKSRIILSISAGVGRPVDIGYVRLILLPRPGFELDNLVVYDNPEFGAEPILRAGEVTASLRLMSLLRGRLEISRLDLTDPSLNLVHSESGRWNLEALLERSSHIPLAPTGKSKSEPRAGFPYIEASSARINFKSGAEKKPFALTNADFSLWQDSENAWGVRLKGQPVRTDLNLNDLGTLQINGTWQRADTFRQTPLQFTVEWSRGQLGQFTKFVTGSDKGWRGAIQVDATLAGTPSQLKINGSASVDDFRRYDITSGSALHLAATCDGKYSTVTHDFHEVICSSPVGQGLLTLTGDMGLPGSHRFAVMLRADNVPANSALMLMSRAKKNLPDDLTAYGRINGNFSVQEDAPVHAQIAVEGQGEISKFQLTSASDKTEISAANIPFLLAVDGVSKRSRHRGDLPTPEGLRLEFGPLSLGTAHNAASVHGWITRAGYDIALDGELGIARGLRLARMAGLPALATSADGAALVDLQLTGTWIDHTSGMGASFAKPIVTGAAQLRNVRAFPHGTGSPIEIASAEMQFTPDAVRIEKIIGKAAGATWRGHVEIPRSCGIACPIVFSLNTNQVALHELTQWASPAHKRPWYRVLEGGSSTPSVLASLHASGHVSAEQLTIHGLSAKRVSAKINVDGGKFEIPDLSADFLNGKYRGDWSADFTAKAAICRSTGKFSAVSLAGLAAEMKDKWVAGTANAHYELKAPCPADFWQDAEGNVEVEMTDGDFPHLTIGDNDEPLRVQHLSGKADLHAGTIEIKETSFDSPSGKYQLTGTASFKRDINLKLKRLPDSPTSSGYVLTGSLSVPRVTPLTRVEQARLKPAAATK